MAQDNDNGDDEDDYIELELIDVVTCTDDAALVKPRELGENIWIPKSQIHPDDRERVEFIIGNATISIKRWFAEKKDLL